MSSSERSQVDLSPLKESEAPIIFVLGGPGSGKGTQCAKMVEKYHLSHLSTGDLLRAETESGGQRGEELKTIMEAGKLVSLEVVLDLLKEAMVKEVEKGSKGFLIDGYPRDVKQGDQFEHEIKPCATVIFFEVSEESMTKRLLGRAATSGRADDNIDTIRKRLETFRNQTQPVVDHYKEQCKLVQIAAEGTVEEIFIAVETALDPMFVMKCE